MSVKAKILNSIKILNFNRKTRNFKKLEKEEWRTVARDIAPSSYKNKTKYLVCDKTIIKYFVIGVSRHGEKGLPKNLSPTILEDLMNIDIGNYTIGITTAVIEIPNYEAANSLQSAESGIIGNQHVEQKSNKSSYISADTRADLKDVNETIVKIHNQDEKMIGQALILAILAEDIDSMKTATGHVKKVLGAKLVRIEEPTSMMELAMQTALPFPIVPNKFQGDPLSHTAAKLLAATDVNVHTDQIGLRLGYRKGHQSQQVAVDLTKLPAGHLLVIGQTGSGKTTAVLAWMYRAYTELGFNCVFITAKKDEKTNHRNVAIEAGDDGIIIDVGPEDQSINPLQIVYDEDNVKDTPFGWASVVHEHINTVVQFFSVFLEEGMSSPKRSYINRTLIELYEQYGIYIDRPETLKKSLRDTKYPLMEDLISIWEKDLKAGLRGDLQKTVYSMINNTFQLGHKGAFSWINRDSNIDISKRFIVIDVSSIKDTKMREAMNVFVTRIVWQKFRANKKNKKDDKKNKRYTIIAIDEAREFFKNQTTRDAIIDQLTQARTDKVFIWLMTQQLTDIKKSGVGEEVQNNIFVDVAFGPDQVESKVELVSKYYHFTEKDERDWILCGTGQAMVMIRGKKTPVEIKLTKYELGMIKGDNLRQRKLAENQSTAIGNPIDERVKKLVEENGLCVASWIRENEQPNDDFMSDAEDYFTALGWERTTFISAIGSGKVKAWIRPRLIINDKVGSQSKTHYATVMQIAGYLLINGIEETSVHHTDNVDVSTRVGDDPLAFEFEMPGSHTGKQLRDKQTRAEVDHALCYFIGTSDNVKFLRQEVVAQNVVQRGVNLKRLLNILIEEQK